MRKIVLAAALIGVLIGSPANAAAGGPEESARAPRTELTLSYQAAAGFAAAVVVTCDPAGGVHPQAEKVCRTLAKVNGNPATIKPAKTMCTLEYAPITAAVTGTWRGQAVTWSKKFSNTCDMKRATGVLFTF
ncbi:SSI family serine proteinase inhibitor [Actinoplanes sp. NPDC051470]|uniref:SSI family serine proteinase inhibitor n=1 Tax=unclassified Actinoplanes TaxID=2626549 RepID=UPI003449A0BB